MDTYKYEGPVLHFETVVTSKWSCYTRASSPAKAKTNMEYRYKVEAGLLPNAKISLAGIPEKVV